MMPACPRRFFPEKGKKLPVAVAFIGHAVTDIGPVETGNEHARALQFQLHHDFLACDRVRRGGERNARNVGKPFVQNRQTPVFGAKIVPPLRNAMRFIDREQRHRHLIQQASISRNRSGQ